MPWEISEEEERAVLHQTANKQYDYFVHKVADWEEVWLVRRGETEYGMLEGDPREDERPESVAVWPHPRYAELCREAGLWDGYEVVAMDVHEFVDGMLTQLIENGRDVAVLPMSDGRSTPVSPRRLRSDLDAELTKYGE
jgi:hypothetical protein